jgi:hypothetical protein
MTEKLGQGLRHTTRRRVGKTHTYWRRVRSAAAGRKVVQRAVAQRDMLALLRQIGAVLCLRLQRGASVG